MSIKELKDVLKYTYLSNKAVLINGKHGIGKSTVVEQFGKENNLYVEVLNLSVMEATDLIGNPYIEEYNSRKSTIYVEPYWFQKIIDKAWPLDNDINDLEFNDLELKNYILSAVGEECKITRFDLNKIYCDFYNLDNSELQLVSNQTNLINKKSMGSIIFLDELNRASQDVRQPALQLVLDKKIQNHKLPFINGKQTFIVSAINPSDLYQTYELDIALLDRFLIVDLKVDLNEWIDYAISINVDNSIIDFVSENPEFLHNINEENEKGSSPRSWVELSEILSNKIDNKKTLELIILGKLGRNVGLNFLNYYNNYSKVFKVENLIEITFKNNKKTIDEIADIIKNETVDIDTIRKQNLLKQLILLASKELETKEYNIMSLTLLTFLMSLNFEISIFFIKKLKIDNKPLYDSLVEYDNLINSKKFFLELIKYTR
jgi:MoxR-like ATPase